MALLKVENGEVIRHVGSRGAFAIQEHVTLPDGRTFPKTYTVWAEGDAPALGALVSVIGVFSAKVREYNAGGEGINARPKSAIDISINDPEVTVQHDVKKDDGAPF